MLPHTPAQLAHAPVESSVPKYQDIYIKNIDVDSSLRTILLFELLGLSLKAYRYFTKIYAEKILIYELKASSSLFLCCLLLGP